MSSQEILRRHFARMGARVELSIPAADAHVLLTWQAVRIDVERDRAGEYFSLRYRGPEWIPEAIDVSPALRHLVLLSRDGRDKAKFLLGHDERHWFAAALPDGPVRDVRSAMESLRPRPARRSGVVRQGEWFFVPAPYFSAAGLAILRHEPLSRGAGSKPHVCDEAVRRGGVAVMVSPGYPTGISLERYQRLVAEDPSEARQSWRRMVRDPEVFVRGRVRHSDHRTIELEGWHRVYMNRERESRFATQVAFLD